MSQSITPYLTVRGGADAIEFYKKAFDATEDRRMPAEDGKRLMHASLTIHGGTVMLSDEFPEHGGPAAPTPEKPASVSVSVSLGKPADVDAVFRQATGAGAKAAMEPADMFWGDRFAMLVDPFGHRWMLVAPLAKS